MHRHHHSCHHSHESASGSGPAWFYGYHHDSGQMKMMTYPEYMNSMQTTYSNMTANPSAMMQQWSNMVQGRKVSDCHCHDKEEHECGCHHHHHEDEHNCDCGCECHVQCADTVEYARCGELRQIPITFENDTRRERNVTLALGSFATRSGTDVGRDAKLSDTTFTLPPCGEKTVVLTVPVRCGRQGTTDGNNPTAANNPPAGTIVEGRPTAVAITAMDVDRCEVAYATLRAEGCRVRPLVVAVAVRPIHCGAYEAECGCGCC